MALMQKIPGAVAAQRKLLALNALLMLIFQIALKFPLEHCVKEMGSVVQLIIWTTVVVVMMSTGKDKGKV